MSSTASFVAQRRRIAVPWLLIGGYTVAALDMLAAIVYWARHGVPASHILQFPATWLLGPSAYHGGKAAVLLGAVIYGHLLWGVVALYHAAARRHPVLLRRPFVCGSLYGVLAYAVIFQVLSPLLLGTRAGTGNPEWIATCVVVYMTLVGIPCALFSLAAEGEHRRASAA